MSSEAQQTTMSNLEYNLVSTIYHSLKAAQTYATFARDAEAAGDQEMVTFFQQMQRQSDSSAQLARQLLVRPTRVGTAH
jgi:rubrerythrin